MCAKELTGLFLDYEYIHKTLDRMYQINPDPNQIIDTLNEILTQCEGNIVVKKAYALWDDYYEAKQAFAENNYEMVNTACGMANIGESTVAQKPNSIINCMEFAICCDVLESVLETGIKDYYLVVGDGRYEDLFRRLQKKGLAVNIIGFVKNIAPNLKLNANSCITLDGVVRHFHDEDITDIVDTFISLSHKLPYVGYKYLMDILSHNELHTDYRQLLNQAQDEGIIQLVEVEDPNTVRGKAFAVKLITEHPVIAKHLQELGMGIDMLASPASLQLRTDIEKEMSSHPGLEDHSDSRFVAGKRLVEIGQQEAAISEFFNYMEDFPNDFLGFVYVINCLVKNGDRKQARLWCKKALNLPNPTNNQKEYPRWFAYMKRLTAVDAEELTEEEEQIEISG
jgi:uncharacterized LabA/DUF88 family protein